MRTLALALALAVALIAPAAAQDGGAALFERWQGRCTVDALTDEERCIAHRSAVVDGGDVAVVGIGQAPGQDHVVAVSVASSFLDRCAVRVDAEPAVAIPGFDPQGCMLFGADATALIGSLRGGTSLLVRLYYAPGGGGYDDVVLPLDGIETALRDAGFGHR